MAGQTPIPVSIGALYRDNVTVQDASTGVFDNTLVDADFTKELSYGTTGGQSVVGITVTKTTIDVVGKYDVLLPATIFPVPGFYTLTLFLTANPKVSWTQEYVASPGGAGMTGPLSFDAAVGDGRVVDETDQPIEGVTVYVQQGDFITAFTTDANGLWGTFYADINSGVWNVTTVKSGYQQGGATLTAGALAITGPGADIQMATVLSANSVAAVELWNYARRMAFNKVGPQADVKIVQLVNDAIDRLARENEWNHYLRRAYVQLNAATTQNVDLTYNSATVTLPAGVWPAWAGNGRLFVNNLILDVAIRVDDTTLTLSAPWGGPTGSYSSTLFQNAYQLPTNFLNFGAILEGQNWPYKPMVMSVQVLWQWENALCVGTQYANAFGIAFGKLWVWPYPTVTQSIAYTYKARPTPLANESDLADIDPTWIETLHKCIDYHVALYFGDCVAGDAKACLGRYHESLSSLPTNDKSPTTNAPVTGGYAHNIPLWRSRSL